MILIFCAIAAVAMITLHYARETRSPGLAAVALAIIVICGMVGYYMLWVVPNDPSN